MRSSKIYKKTIEEKRIEEKTREKGILKRKLKNLIRRANKENKKINEDSFREKFLNKISLYKSNM